MTDRVKNPFRAKAPGRGDNAVPKQLRNTDNRRKPKLNVRERKFVDNYALTLNARESARQSGYGDLNYAYELLRKPKIQEAILARRQKIEQLAEDTFELKAKDILYELALVAFQNVGDYFDDWGFDEKARFNAAQLKSKSRLTEKQLRAISEVSETLRGNTRSFKFKTYSKMDALTRLGQYLGLWDGGIAGEDPFEFVRKLRQATAEAEGTMPGGGG